MTSRIPSWSAVAAALGAVRLIGALATALLPHLSCAAAETVPQVVVVGTTPLGDPAQADTIASNVQTLTTAELDPNHRGDPLPSAAARRLASLNFNEQQGSPYQSDFVYRGFEASPISGVAEGLAVYQNGVRINETFGDAVNWDLVPQFAVQRFTVQSNNPVFGLNALGGAVTLDMKNGFTAPGPDAQISYGRFGDLSGYAAYGARRAGWALYAGAGGVSDQGFRERSPTHLRQGYADLGYEGDTQRWHLSFALADNDLHGLGPTPVQRLAADPAAVFTGPQQTQNAAQLLQLSSFIPLAPHLTLSASVYYRHLIQHLIDGNASDVTVCANDTAYFCLGGALHYPADLLYDAQGAAVPTSVLPGGATPGQTALTRTETDTSGVTLQLARTGQVLGRDNRLTVGASVDDSHTHYDAEARLGYLRPDLTVISTPLVIDQTESPGASPPLLGPVAVRAATDYLGIYATSTLQASRSVALTLSARANSAQVRLTDLRGSALDASHRFERLNPGAGVTYRLGTGASAYAGYSEANRAPTAGELSCADPRAPCVLDAFLVADPPLKQVVARTLEAGLRGDLAGDEGRVHWFATLFRTQSSDDILLIATALNGFGYFANAGSTRRQGLELGLTWQRAPWRATFGYARVEATFRHGLTLPSNSPAADAQGNIFVPAGARLPLSPRDRVTTDLEYESARGLSLGMDLRYTGSQFLAGDQSNQEPPLPSYTLVDLHLAWALRASLQLFAGVDNLFDRTYYTYGNFTPLAALPPGLGLSNPRTLSPGTPRVYYFGVRTYR
ncbi:MAG: TonB-dependent receptor [Gammaproteobacteria bacterium]|nr:TonB-dependent receptor [Gammaproteobacteria bacterium]